MFELNLILKQNKRKKFFLVYFVYSVIQGFSDIQETSSHQTESISRGCEWINFRTRQNQ